MVSLNTYTCNEHIHVCVQHVITMTFIQIYMCDMGVHMYVCVAHIRWYMV